jgi:hypothetical protein
VVAHLTPGGQRLRAQVKAPAQRLAAMLLFVDSHRVWGAADNDENAGQLLATYYRRLAELHRLNESELAIIT